MALGMHSPANRPEPSDDWNSAEQKAAGRHSLTGYRLRLILPVLLLSTYVVAALFGPRYGHPEFYPFFSWSLFTYTSDSQSDTVIIVRGVEGEALEEPKLFFDMAYELGAVGINRISLAKLLDKYGRAAMQGDTQVADQLSQVIENTYLHNLPQIS